MARLRSISGLVGTCFQTWLQPVSCWEAKALNRYTASHHPPSFNPEAHALKPEARKHVIVQSSNTQPLEQSLCVSHDIFGAAAYNLCQRLKKFISLRPCRRSSLEDCLVWTEDAASWPWPGCPGWACLDFRVGWGEARSLAGRGRYSFGAWGSDDLSIPRIYLAKLSFVEIIVVGPTKGQLVSQSLFPLCLIPW